MRSFRAFLATACATAALATTPAYAASTLFTFTTSGNGTSYIYGQDGIPIARAVTGVTFAFQISDQIIPGGDITQINGSGGSYGGFSSATSGYSFNLIDILQKAPTQSNISVCFSNPSGTFSTFGTISPTCGSSVSYSGTINSETYPSVFGYVGKVDQLIVSRVASDNTFFNAIAAIPEPSTWALMLAGFGMVGYAMRRRKVAFA